MVELTLDTAFVNVSCTPGRTAPLGSLSTPETAAGACGGAATAAAARGKARCGDGTGLTRGVVAGSGATKAISDLPAATTVETSRRSVSVTAASGTATANMPASVNAAAVRVRG